MKRSSRKIVRRLLIGAVGFLVLIGVLLIAALYSETVFRLAVNAARPVIPGELRYGSLEGTLAGPVHATGLDYRTADTRIEAASLSFDLAPFALLGKRVRIAAVDARDLVITLPPGDEQAEPPQDVTVSDILDKLALPIQLEVPGARIRGITLQQPNGETLFALDRLNFSLHWNDRRIAVSDLDADGPALTAKGSALVGLKADVNTDVDLDVAWRNEPVALAARLAAQGTPRELALNLELDQPGRAKLHATLFDLLDTPRWQGTLRVDKLSLDAVRPTLPPETWSLNLDFEGDEQDTALQATLAGAWPPVTGIDLAIDGKVNAQRLLIDNLSGTLGALEARVDASAELHYADDLRYAARGTFDHLAWPGLEGIALRDVGFDINGNAESLRAQVQAATGEADDALLRVGGELAFDTLRFDATASGQNLQLAFNGTPVNIAAFDASANGTPDDYRLQAEVRADAAELPAARLALTAQGDTTQLRANIEAFEWLNGRATGDVHVAWQDALKLDAQLRAQGFTLDPLDGQLAGTLGGEFAVSANLAGEQPDVSIDIASLDGRIDGVTVDGNGSVRLANGRLSTDGLSLRAGDARLVLKDAPSGGFDFELDAPALSRLHAALAGEVHASGRIEGDLASPTLTVNAEARDLLWQDWQVAAATLNADIRDGGNAPSQWQLNATDIGTPFINAAQVRLDASGAIDEHQVNLTVGGAGRDGQGQFAFATEGGWRNSQWQGDIDTLRFGHPLTGDWSLANPRADKRIVLGANELGFPEHCLEGPEGSVCLGPASGDFENPALQGRLDGVPVSMLAAWLPKGLDYEGRIAGQFGIRPGEPGPVGQLQLQLTPGGIRQAVGEGYETLLGWESGMVSVNLDGETARGNLEVHLADEDRITGRGEVSLSGEGPARIDAKLQARVQNLQIVPSLVPELSRLRGVVTASLDIGGTLDEPRMQGSAQLRNGSARILALGTDWNDVSLTLNANGRELSGTGHVESGDGHIDIELTGRDSGDGFIGEARITGENFKAMQTPEANVDITPDLGVKLDGQDLYIDGSVFVPMAHIEPRDLETATQVSEDQVIVNEEQAPGSEGLRVHAAVTTRLGDDVRLDGFGLTARLEGEVTVTQEPGNPPIGNGRLIVVEGEYQAYGQDLTLAKGEIIYAGQPITNPGLDIRAERRPQPEIMVGVSVRGPLENPTTSIYSDPPMSETQALALLLFGRTIDEATGSETAQINEASVALGLGGGKLLQNVGERLGVEEVSVQDIGNRERASLVLGKYLSPDLYVSYGIGLFEAVNSFSVRYRISRRWTLEATSGLKSSADFIYTIER